MKNTKSTLPEQVRRLRIDATVFSDQHPQLYSMLAGLHESIRGASLLSLALEASANIQISASYLYQMASHRSPTNHDVNGMSVRLNRYIDKDEYHSLLKHLDALPRLRGTHIVELASAGLSGVKGKSIKAAQHPTGHASVASHTAIPKSTEPTPPDTNGDEGNLNATEVAIQGLHRGAKLDIFSMKGKRPPGK